MSTAFPDARAAEITSRLRRLFEEKSVPFSFVPCLEGGDVLRYFSTDTQAELARLAKPPFVHVPNERLEDARILISTSHGGDVAEELWALRRRAHPEALIALWLWDNHVALVPNLRTSLAADLLFASHAYACSYLANPVSVLGPPIPSCSVQWTAGEAGKLFTQLGAQPRKDKLLVNYVDYPWAWRSELLRALAAQAPEAKVLTMPTDARQRYFGKSSTERFREWASYKCTVLLPVDKDLSTRLFDALLAGMVPVVPRMVEDFDAVVPPADQEKLGIVRIDSVDLAVVRAGAREALARFDRMGPPGTQARHRYALEHHLLGHRIGMMLHVIRSLGTGSATVGVLPDGALHTRAP